MSRTKPTIAAAALLLALAGCSSSAGAPPSADDPRDGRVTIVWSNCATGSCIYDWKICVGPDLEMHIDREVRTVKGSPECTPRPAKETT